MITPHYQEELARLKELGAEFAAAHPALAPLLGGPSADPDVERLLEGVAFQTALLRRKLDDDFPEVVHDLMRLVAPHYLRPVPATTIVAFAPKPSLVQSQTIPAGVQLASVPVEGTRCLFRTTSPVELHPLELLDASFAQPAGRGPAVTLSLQLSGIPLDRWEPRSLRLFLAGDYVPAAELFLILSRHLKRIVLTPAEGGTAAILPAHSLQPAGFADDEPLIPYPPHAFPGYRLLQEYLTAPRRFLFLELTGWERWTGRGSGTRFTVTFELGDLPFPPPRVKRESIALFATPAVNLFPADADPILLDHRAERHLVRPAGLPRGHGQIHSVDRVTGFIRGSATERPYHPFEQFREPSAHHPAFHTSVGTAPVRAGFDVHLSVAYPKGEGLPEPETLSAELTCSNGRLPESLRIGDLREPTASSPDGATFRNLAPVTPALLPPLGKNLLWRLVSHLALNRLSLASADNLRALLSLYLFDGGGDQTALAAHRRRIAGIEAVTAAPADRLVGGHLLRGSEITLTLRGDHFAGPGDLFLFGSVLDRFLGGYAALNSYTRLTVRESVRGEEYPWPPRLGQRPLL
ncbi:type VI secretion system baseplate subunit TssF [Geobacter pickeringii]|uniref:Type VI secretion system protein ImpG n=1 Tax=Geobacter pickeringii TaxID=345632 RepID=A0A0B5BKD0_9BACT|nr:type VI secretion system baseplate subunit TssF [Geobacter pickeringii]AJE04516.1 type VI secretion system protein ImpG [Geobacter pickeringii]